MTSYGSWTGCRGRVRRISAFFATSSTLPTTAMTSNGSWTHMRTASLTSRSPTTPAVASPAPGHWISTITYPASNKAAIRATPPWSTSRPARPWTAWTGCHRNGDPLHPTHGARRFMSTIAFIGLGIMGGPMAGHLVQAGHTVVGHNRSPAPVQRLVEAGGQGAESVAEAVSKADVIITMVPDSPDVEGLALGDDGIYANARSGAIHLDMSSIRPDVSVRLAEAGRERGIRVLDAPVSGGEAGAKEATLSIMVGGEESDFKEARPILEAVGSTIVYVGPAGSGQTVKAANQLIVAGTIELVAEAIVFLEAYGVDTEAAVSVLAGGLAGNAILERKAAGMLRRDFTPGFRIELHDKDMGIVTSAAREAGVVIPLGAVVAQLVASLKAQGDGGLDHSALLKLVEQLSGRGRSPTD